MAINLERAPESLFGLIPPSQYASRKKAGAKDSKLPLFQFLRVPRTIEELEPYQHGVVVSMDNGTMIYINSGKRTSPIRGFEKSFTVSNSHVCVDIMRDSDDSVVETAVLFGTLENTDEKVTFGYNKNMNMDSTRADQLAFMLDKNCEKKMWFDHTDFNQAALKVIATRPYPMDLTLKYCFLDFHAFTHHLEERRLSFGSFHSMNESLDEEEVRPLFNESFHVNLLPVDLVPKILGAPTKSVGFSFINDDIRLLDVVNCPKAIRIDFVYEEFPTEFLQSFFDKIHESGHLESLELFFFSDGPVPNHVGKALLAAVEANRKLNNLVLADCGSDCDAFVKDLFTVLENHQELRTFGVCRYPVRLDPDFLWMKRLLETNRNLEITDTDKTKLRFGDDEVHNIISLNRFFRGSKSLMRKLMPLRLSLVVAALTYKAAHDFERAGLLLNDHLDLFIELLDERTSIASREAIAEEMTVVDLPPNAASVASAESSGGRPRKRKIDSSTPDGTV
ncbi:hypothetical protein FisN_12Lu170 [Fistulifera solaris]|uniref:Uncharacterized protein n=1 Tax=Fistulifera solaris TaxID=1519565 RepID=A0A1Z5JN55_FISSO|nr:hypothetical protein FisN_12Lu170 [Fistulifera solaris]|eukprot:GAX15221.1 hypothetical protein FisN_12Lu170 [Fistulifera solaris]